MNYCEWSVVVGMNTVSDQCEARATTKYHGHWYCDEHYEVMWTLDSYQVDEQLQADASALERQVLGNEATSTGPNE